MANTGNLIQPRLIRVANDGSKTPLDANNRKIGNPPLSQLPPVTMDNPTDSETYKILKLDSCPVNPDVPVYYSTDYRLNPYTLAGIDLLRDGLQVPPIGIRILFPSQIGLGVRSNSLGGIFSKGQVINVRLMSLLQSYPWVPGSRIELTIKMNGQLIHSFTATTQADLLHTYDIITDYTSNRVDIDLRGYSNAVNYITHAFNTFITHSIGIEEVTVKVEDLATNLVSIQLPPYNGADRLYYNVLNDNSLLKITISNNTASPKYIYLVGPGGFIYQKTIPPLTDDVVTGNPPKGTYTLFDLDMDGYVRMDYFSNQNCPAERPNPTPIPFAKAYVDQTAANADTVNFNNLGQTNANNNGSCTV